MNSFRHKFAQLQEILSKHRIDCLAISESKLDDSFPDAQFNVQGYNIFRQDNTSSSGGLIIYVRSDIPHRRLINAEYNHDGIESLCLELTIGKTKTVFSCVYKHPKVEHTIFKERLGQITDYLLQSYNDLVFLGDMNSCPTKTSVISELCYTYRLQNVIIKATCFKGTTPSLIDVIGGNTLVSWIVIVILVTYTISLVLPPDDLPHLGNHAMHITGVTKISMTLIFVMLYQLLLFTSVRFLMT